MTDPRTNMLLERYKRIERGNLALHLFTVAIVLTVTIAIVLG